MFYALQDINDSVNILIPEELSEQEVLAEGVATRITVNRYERNLRARKLCIEHYGVICCVCNFEFSTIYGIIGGDYMHVHHIIPLSNIKDKYVVDPIKYLRPVCPNCHSMIHRNDPPLSVEELKRLIDLQKILLDDVSSTPNKE